jgi:hypothetical protein
VPGGLVLLPGSLRKAGTAGFSHKVQQLKFVSVANWPLTRRIR